MEYLSQSISGRPAVLIASTLLTSLAVICLYLVRSQKQVSGLPPSPPAHPLWGHATILTAPFQWKIFTELGKDLGSTIYLSVLGQPIVVLNSAEVARDLMEKRGSKYSDRAGTILFGDMYGAKNMLPALPYGDRFRTQRRMMQQTFNSQAVKTFRDYQSKQVVIFLSDLLEDRNSFRASARKYIEATIMKATYGHDVVSKDDKYVRLAVEMAEASQNVGALGASLVDCLPILQHIPAWFPGARFKRDALAGRKKTEALINIPFDELKGERGNGIRGPSLLERVLEEYESSGTTDREYELNAKNLAAIIYIAALDTSLAASTMFLLMMTLHPEVAKRAQAEIDRVVGNERLPGFEDRERLPYIDCILKEVLRIHPPGPLGVSHQSTEEDIYLGMRIPSKSVIMPNIWCMMRDGKYFDRADEFHPERFLEKVKSYTDSNQALNGFFPDDPSSIIFGFGRRICPGRYFADANLWLFIACFLAVFDVGCYVNPESGLEEKPEIKLTSSIVSLVEPFNCTITPRSELHSKLVSELVHSMQ